MVIGLVISLSVFSQEKCDLNYSGIVLDKHDNQPVPYAKIQFREGRGGAITDSAGYFRISSLCPGTYTFVCFHHVGCKPERLKIELQASRFDTLYIEFHYQELEEATITHTVFAMPSLSVVRPDELDKRFGLGKTLGEILKQIPGVSSLNTGSSISKPVIHGMHSNRIVTLNNEIKQEGQQWGNEHAPEIDPFLSADISVIKGAGAIRHGSDAIAGVISLAPEKLSFERGIRGKLQSTAFSNGRSGSLSALLESAYTKNSSFFAWRVQGTVKQGGTVHTPSYYIKNTALKEYNFSWNTLYRYKKLQTELFYSQFNTDLGIFSGAHVGNLTDLQKAFESTEPIEQGTFTYTINRPKQHIEHELFKVKTGFTFNARNKLNLVYGRQYNQRQEYDNHLSYNDSIAALNLPSFNFTLTTHSLDLRYEHRFHQKLMGEIGISTILQKNSWSGRFFIPNFRKQSAGVYWLEVLKWKNNELELGLRADYVNMHVYLYEQEAVQDYRHEFQKVNAALGFSKSFGHHLVFRANLSSAWRPPSINELYSNGLHHGAAAIEVGKRDLKIEESFGAQSGITYKSLRFTAQADVYHTLIGGYIYLKPTLVPELTIKGAFPVFEFEQVNARFTGLDLFFSFSINDHFDLNLKAAIVRAFNSSGKSFLVGIPPDRFEPSVSYGKELKKGRKILFSLTAPLVRTQDRIDPNSDYVAPPKGYALMNFQALCSFQVKKQQLDLSLEVSNIGNTAYRDYMNRFRYFSDEMGRNIGLKIVLPLKIKNHEK